MHRWLLPAIGAIVTFAVLFVVLASCLRSLLEVDQDSIEQPRVISVVDLNVDLFASDCSDDRSAAVKQTVMAARSCTQDTECKLVYVGGCTRLAINASQSQVVQEAMRSYRKECSASEPRHPLCALYDRAEAACVDGQCRSLITPPLPPALPRYSLPPLD